jgi:rhodanese-related sulfurtransferase
MTRQRTKEQLASKPIWAHTLILSSFTHLSINNLFARFFGLALLLNGLLACTTTTEKGIGNASKHTQAMQSAIEDIDVTTFAALMEQDSVIILDVRTLAEVNAGAIEGAIHLDFYQSDFQDKLSTLDKNSTYLVYCRSGNRSSQASALMTERLGFKDVKNLLGGYQAWAKQ